MYAAPTEETALSALELFRDKWDTKYPKICKFWHENWANLSTYFKYPEAVRRLIYTTNSIEGFNRQLRKATKSKVVFPSDDSLIKMLYLATMDIARKWTGRRQDWGHIRSQLEIYFEERCRSEDCNRSSDQLQIHRQTAKQPLFPLYCLVIKGDF